MLCAYVILLTLLAVVTCLRGHILSLFCSLEFGPLLLLDNLCVHVRVRGRRCTFTCKPNATMHRRVSYALINARTFCFFFCFLFPIIYGTARHATAVKITYVSGAFGLLLSKFNKSSSSFATGFGNRARSDGFMRYAFAWKRELIATHTF